MSSSNDWSYLHAPNDTPCVYLTICDCLDAMVSQGRNHLAAVYGTPDGFIEKISLIELCTKAKALAKYLINSGIKRLDRIAIIGSNSIPWIIGDLAVIYAGCIAVHISVTRKDGSEFIDAIKSANLKGLLIDDKDSEIARTVFSFADTSGLKVIFLENIHDILLKDQSDDILLPPVYPEDGAFVFSTSGSTGRYKLVQHTHQAILSMYRVFQNKNQHLNIYSDRAFCWIGGYPIASICLGDTRIFMKTNISLSGMFISNIWNFMKTTGTNIALLMPCSVSDVFENAESIETIDYTLEKIFVGGEMVKHAEKLLGQFCKELIITYGQTEFGIATTTLLTNNYYNKNHNGRPINGVEIRIVDPDGHPVSKNTCGAIQLRGNNRCLGYLDYSDNLILFTVDGWLHTGDIGYIAVDDLVVVGREKQIISRGTRKILPSVLENIIQEFEGVQEVIVVGIPHKRLGEEVCVCYREKELNSCSGDDMKKKCKLTFFKPEAEDGLGEMPSHFVQFESFPKLSNGKIDRSAVRDIAQKKIMS